MLPEKTLLPALTGIIAPCTVGTTQSSPDAEISVMTQKNFGATIRALREAQQISLRKFADKVGISPTYLSKIERDEFPPPGEETVKKFAEALNQDTDELLALAGKVSSDLPAIIQQRPRELASFLRTASELNPDEMARLRKYVDRIKRPS